MFLKSFLLVLVVFCVEISCQNVKYKALKETLGEEPTEPVSKSISDVIDEFYIKNNIDFDFIIYGNTTNHINDVINELKNFPATIQHIPDFLNWNHKLNRSAIFFINSLTEVQYLHVKSIQTSVGTQFTNLESRNFKFLVYIKNAGTFEFVDNKTQTKKISKLTLNLRTFSDLMFYEFLLFNDGNRIILAANVFYSEKKCAKSHLRKLNSFDLETQKWNKKLENFDHYANFHGCIISFIMQIRNEFYVKDFKNISALNERFSDNGLKFSGVFYTLIEKLAVKHNFTIQYWIYGEDINLYTKNYKTPPLLCLSFLKITRLKSCEFPFHYDSKPLYTYDFYFLISLNDLYTNYEKLSFPFDTKTWILIFLTFSLTFTSIFGLHFCP
ncbi:hypothetical protein PVAND_009056 [Polypedilum vanderplanki]|uniref:Ionotropic receptor n=1 Tax=Polypedilum vanderplanki TaxID=319348 RepID=A0A9J6CBI5_POLVA|nr:hypothetical protein PVAND_009056 [Polypedilum vanderplanki]